VARAHGLETPTLMARPHVLDLIDEDHRTLSLARMQPPAGEYCSLRVKAQSADADAVGLASPKEARGGIDMQGLSLALAGRFVHSDDTEDHSFELTSDAVEEASLPLVDEAGEPARVVLSASRRLAELRLELQYYPLLDGVELSHDDQDVQSFLALRNLLQHARAVVAQ
jgi:hypothetical protein